jgi:hypothetical protein
MIDLARIEMNLLTGRKPGDLPENADSPQRFVRAWIHVVRGLLREHRGDEEGAKKSYSKAIKGDSHQGFVSATARRYLDPKKQPVRDQPDRDPAVERKKRKGR